MITLISHSGLDDVHSTASRLSLSSPSNAAEMKSFQVYSCWNTYTSKAYSTMLRIFWKTKVRKSKYEFLSHAQEGESAEKINLDPRMSGLILAIKRTLIFNRTVFRKEDSQQLLQKLCWRNKIFLLHLEKSAEEKKEDFLAHLQLVGANTRWQEIKKSRNQSSATQQGHIQVTVDKSHSNQIHIQL